MFMGISKKPWPILSVCGFKNRIETILQGYLYSPDSLMNPYGRGLRIEGR